jgi:hypothetical protein
LASGEASVGENGIRLFSWVVPQFQTKGWRKTHRRTPRRDPQDPPDVEWKGVGLKGTETPQLWLRFPTPLFEDGRVHALTLVVGEEEMDFNYQAPGEIK